VIVVFLKIVLNEYYKINYKKNKFNKSFNLKWIKKFVLFFFYLIKDSLKFILVKVNEFNFGSGWTLSSSFKACKSLLINLNINRV
jgi:hypothetical protein